MCNGCWYFFEFVYLCIEQRLQFGATSVQFNRCSGKVQPVTPAKKYSGPAGMMYKPTVQNQPLTLHCGQD